MLVLLSSLVHVPVSFAQQACPEAKRQFTGYWENDLRILALGLGTDEAYTNGVRFEIAGGIGDGTKKKGPLGTLFPLAPTREAPPSAQKREYCFAYKVAIAHLLYTPTNIETEVLQANDRPYAGWFYVSYELTRSDFTADPSRADTVAVDLGLLGPGAGGEGVQDTIHRWNHIPSRVGQSYKKPLGWHHQLRNEPTLNLRVLRRQRLVTDDATGGSKRNWDAIVHYGGALGNVFTWAQSGVMGRVGINLPSDLGPQRIPAALPPLAASATDASRVPTVARSSAQPRRWYAYGFAGTEGRAILRNAFLDGNLLTENRPDMGHVDKRPFVGDVEWGGVVAWGRVAVAYHNVVRSSEFKTPVGQEEGSVNNHPHRFGSVAVTLGASF